MGFYDAANSPVLYAMVTDAVLSICGLTYLYMAKSWKRARELGYSREKLREVGRRNLSILSGIRTSFLNFSNIKVSWLKARFRALHMRITCKPSLTC